MVLGWTFEAVSFKNIDDWKITLYFLFSFSFLFLSRSVSSKGVVAAYSFYYRSLAMMPKKPQFDLEQVGVQYMGITSNPLSTASLSLSPFASSSLPPTPTRSRSGTTSPTSPSSTMASHWAKPPSSTSSNNLTAPDRSSPSWFSLPRYAHFFEAGRVSNLVKAVRDAIGVWADAAEVGEDGDIDGQHEGGVVLGRKRREEDNERKGKEEKDMWRFFVTIVCKLSCQNLLPNHIIWRKESNWDTLKNLKIKLDVLTI